MVTTTEEWQMAQYIEPGDVIVDKETGRPWLVLLSLPADPGNMQRMMILSSIGIIHVSFRDTHKIRVLVRPGWTSS